MGKNRWLMAWRNFGKSWSFHLNKQNCMFLMMEMRYLKEKLTQPGRQEKYIQMDTSKVFRCWKNQREEPKVFHAGIRRPVASRKLMKLVKYLEISNRNSRVTMSETVRLQWVKYEQKYGSVWNHKEKKIEQGLKGWSVLIIKCMTDSNQTCSHRRRCCLCQAWTPAGPKQRYLPSR